jgi:mono/diheme cytochrome c family protein
VKPCIYRQIARWLLVCLAAAGASGRAADVRGAAEFHDSVRPILERYCFDCHGDGASKGKVAFDQFKSDQAVLDNRELWWKALKNLRAGLMPPAKKPRPTSQEQEQIAHWIKAAVFGIDPQNPDPGRVTLRRLNRVEYHNTIQDLLGVDFDTQGAFPPDDTGYGFDTIGDVLTLSPMLLEKYLMAAEKIVGQAVPVESKIMPEKIIRGKRFQGLGDGGGNGRNGGLALSYYKPASVSNTLTAQWAGKYKLGVDLMVNEHYVDNVFDYNKCRLIFQVDGRELLRREFSWEGGKRYHYDFDQDWAAGNHLLAFQLQPLTPDQEQTRTLTLQITSVTVSGPAAREHWVQPGNYSQFFPKVIPAGAKERRRYARELLGGFARKAFRRPVDEKTVDRLAALAEGVYAEPGKTFEAGVAEGMVAVLASPRFLFREEGAEPGRGQQQRYPFVDEFSLASRLSYFLWSSMPDDELIRLAGEGRLRQDFSAQVARMLRDKRSEALVRDFTGQWLRGRDIEDVPIDARSVLAREEKFDPERTRLRKRFRELNDKSDESLTKEEKEELAGIRAVLFKNFARRPRINFDGELRADMRQETEGVFNYVLREDRSLLELLDSDYTFLNHRLAAHYGITNVSGDEMRRVTLPPDSPRGGVLTEGTVLAVTSNPTRTSPVKRGLFILDNILGTPPPPPPPNIPPLEDAAKGVTNHALSLRATLALHRKDPLCSSCHNRMDPLGLAFENFNAMGMWRQAEYGDPIDATGTLTTGESFANIKELKHILVTNHAKDFYRTLTEKMLTYALGRGLDYYDAETVDQIVARLEASNGRASVLLAGVVESAPFQKCRPSSSISAAVPSGQPVTFNLDTP